ncbi:MAG: hypothetical protein OIF38_10480 [Cellvibrionaceae bacterium]|nr:hypothetical protein [Cellvibrionaceae bacterium]
MSLYLSIAKYRPLGLSWYQLLKYSIYALLSYNLYLFIVEETQGLAGAYPQGLNLGNFVEAYSATVDTAAWVVLLYVFELETAVLSDRRLRGPLGYALAAIKAVCYGFILYALYGYVGKYLAVSAVSPAPIQDACLAASQGWLRIESLNDYPSFSPGQCQALSGPLFSVDNTQIIGDHSQIRLLHNLAGVDVLNAAAWVVLVAVLQLEVVLQLRQALSHGLMMTAKLLKAPLYLLLLAAAIYWGIDGEFLDFWDAFLWLLAFFLIDLNIFEWHEEVQQEAQQQAGQTEG